MTYKLLAAAAFSLALGTAAIAQTGGTAAPGGGVSGPADVNSAMPSGWDDTIGDAFFSDRELGTLRSQEEISANWNNLSEEQQAQVRSHCDTMDTAANTTDAPAGGGAASGGAAEGDDVNTGSTTADSAVHMASIQQVCDWIDTM